MILNTLCNSANGTFVTLDDCLPDTETSRSDYLQKYCGRSWSSQEWKSEAGERDRSEKPEENSWDSLQEVDHHRE